MSVANDTQTTGDGPPSLLAADEPRPFESINPEGDPRVLLTCDHASRFIPRALNQLGLDEATLLRHIAWDIGAAEVTRHLARRLDLPALLSGFSRLVIDPNRKPDAESSIPAISDGVTIPGNLVLSAAAAKARRRDLFEPYHAATAALLDRAAGQGIAPAIISVHSFTPVMDGVERPWQVGILWNRDGRLADPLIARLRALGLTVGDNEPYSGRDFHGYSMQTHGDARGLANVLVELRQDLIDTHHGAEAWAKTLGEVLAEVLRDPGLYRAAASGS